MGLIIELIGGRGSGKSTLIKRLKETYADCRSVEGFRKMDTGCDLGTLEGFVNNERAYIRRAIAEYGLSTTSDGMTIITSGAREIFFYLEYQAARHYPSQPILDILKEDISALSRIFSPNVIVLRASENKLRDNINNDKSKHRRNVDFWIEFSSYVQEKMKSDVRSNFIDTDNLTGDEVYVAAVKLIAEMRKK